jgi:hypothetical protein
MIVDRKYPPGTKIAVQGKPMASALYFIRSGKIEVTHKDGRREVYEEGGYVGHETLESDAIKNKNGPKDPTTVIADSTITVVEECVCGVLPLERCRVVIDTRFIGKPHTDMTASIKAPDIKIEALERHTILGAGKCTFIVLLYLLAF